MRHVLVDAAEDNRLYLHAGLLLDLAYEAGVDRLVQLQHAAWGLPRTAIAPADRQDPAVVADDDADDCY